MKTDLTVDDIVPAMQTVLSVDLDLDAPPAAAKQQPRWRTTLPWILFGTTLGLFVASLAFQIPRPAASDAQEPAPTTAPAEPTTPVIDMESTGGVSTGPTAWRDASGQLIAMMLPVAPFGQETVTCRLVVDGEEVTDEGVDGQPAVCVWVRGAADA